MLENIILSLGFYTATVILQESQFNSNFIMDLLKKYCIYKSFMKILYIHLKYQLSLSHHHMRVLGCNTHLNCYRDFGEVEENKV